MADQRSNSAASPPRQNHARRHNIATQPAQPGAIEDYALIGDCLTAALVNRGGADDSRCWRRVDSSAGFAALHCTPEIRR
jgi:hypothetical protein